MNLQMKAEREKRSIELNAMAEKEAVIRKAEAIANHIINGFFCALHLAKNQTINGDINIVFGNN
jgi:uncharacterized protein (DUF1778 family)